MMKLKHKGIKQSFSNLVFSIRRANKKVQERIERNGWQEAVQRGVHFCPRAGKGASAAECLLQPLSSTGRTNMIN